MYKSSSDTLHPLEPGFAEGWTDATAYAATAYADTFTVPDDPLWLMVDKELTPAREHEFESLFAVSNGYLGNRASLPFGIPLSAPATYIAGVFDAIPPSSLPELVAVPGWTLLSASIGPDRLAIENPTITEHRRILDMQNGMFRRIFRFIDEEGHITQIRFLRIASLVDRHLLLQSSLLMPENYSGTITIRSGFLQASTLNDNRFSACAMQQDTPAGSVQILEGKTHSGIGIALAVATRFVVSSYALPELKIRRTTGRRDDLIEMEVEAGKTYRNDWLQVCYTSRDVDRPTEAAFAHLAKLLQEDVNPPIWRHIDAWEARWHTADVEINGDNNAQRAIRFACYHLISAANPNDEHVSIGAKALTGPGYKGHVFWDTEIYLLPFYTLTFPPAARALLMYRYHTLPASRDKAHRYGYRGALYAWESAGTGEESTPTYAITPLGKVVPVLSGTQEHHISADVAYAVWQYWEATEDDEFMCNAGAEILIETARFWASRGRIEADGLYHIRKVMGPDEYHLGVSDNAYTNWMAQWNLECAGAAAALLQQRWPQQWQRLAQRIQLNEAEPAQWLTIAGKMFTCLHPKRGLIEQFEGYLDLDEIDLAQYEPRSMPIDVILGEERMQRAKIIKQADVLMLVHLLWRRIPAEMRETNFRYYEPRTEHGSSLSPTIHALLAARLGDTEMALRYFQQAREIDLADNMGNAASGVHIASLGGIWQAIVFGFAGLTLSEQGLTFSPHCPASWDSIRFYLHWRRQKLQVQVSSQSLEIELIEGTSLPIVVEDLPAICLVAGRKSRWKRSEDSWIEVAYVHH